MKATPWLPLGSVIPARLVEARLELHHAAQLAAALGIARAAPQPDYGHHALTVDATRRRLIGAPVAGRRVHRAALALEEPTLLFLTERDTPLEELPLAGRTPAEALEWLAEASARLTGLDQGPIPPAPNELPDHPLAHGARFGAAEPGALRELARWFANLAGALAELRHGRAASPLRVWSHHFDLDTVLELGDERRLGLGFSPGDETHAAPYLYALPDPAPEAGALPTAPAPLRWVTDGWIGALLPGQDLAQGTAAEQARRAAGFYRDAERLLAAAAGAG